MYLVVYGSSDPLFFWSMLGSWLLSGLNPSSILSSPTSTCDGNGWCGDGVKWKGLHAQFWLQSWDVTLLCQGISIWRASAPIPTVYAIAPIVRTVRYCIFIDTLEMSLNLYCRWSGTHAHRIPLCYCINCTVLTCYEFKQRWSANCLSTVCQFAAYRALSARSPRRDEFMRA